MSKRGLSAILLSLALLAAACVNGDDAETVADGQPDDESGEETTGTDDGTGATGTDDSGAEEAQDGRTTTTTATSTSEPVETTTATAGALDVELTLLDPGAEPRSQLRLAVPDGQTEVMVVQQSQRLVQEVDGQPLQDIRTDIVTRTELTATVIDGGYRISSVIVSAEAGPDADPAVAAQVTQGLQSIIGIETTTEMDDFGGPMTAAEVSGTEGLDPAIAELANAGSQLAAPLPSEPVGVGASWQVTLPISILGIETEQTTTYTLTDVSGTVITIASTGVQTVEPGSTLNQGGVSVEVVGWDTSTEGSLVLDLGSMVPTSSADTRSTQTFAMAGASGNLEQTVEIEVMISSE